MASIAEYLLVRGGNASPARPVPPPPPPCIGLGDFFAPSAPETTKLEALEGAVDILGIGLSDETKRRSISLGSLSNLPRIDGGVDAASLRDQAVKPLGGALHLSFTVKGRTTYDGNRTQRREEPAMT